MDAQLQQIIELQKEQNQLLKKHLWQIKFSLLSLLLLTTSICCFLGIASYKSHRLATTNTFQAMPIGNWTVPGTIPLDPVAMDAPAQFFPVGVGKDVTPVPDMPPPRALEVTTP